MLFQGKHSKHPPPAGADFLTQHDQSDCGVVCLANIISYHGGSAQLEKIRSLSGTDRRGTTLLGLYQAASGLGFEVQGLQADTGYLKVTDNPVIVHVVTDNKLNHYLIVYRYSEGKFLTGDPSKGIAWMEEKRLDEIWKSKSLLELKPIEGKFIRRKARKNMMREWFVNIVSEDSTILTTIFLTGIVVSLLGVSLAVYSQTLIDTLIPAGDIKRIVIATLLFFFLLIFRILINYFRQSFIIRQSRDINIRMIGRFFGGLLRQPFTFFNSRHTGDMVARLNDTGKIQQTITYITGELLINALVLIVSLVAVFIYHPPAGLMLSSGIPACYFIVHFYHSTIRHRQLEVMAAHALNESNYISTIENIPVIKTSGKETLFTRSGKTIYRHFQKQVYRLGQTAISINILTETAGIILILGVIALSVAAMLKGTMQTGQFIALMTLTGNIIPAGSAIAFANIHLQSARVAFERIYEISAGEPEYDYASEKSSKNTGTAEALELRNISFRYPGRKLLLDNVSLELKRGEIRTVFGENGSGKSTLLNIIQKFYLPESGDILLNGEDLSRLSIHSFRKILGVIPQNISLFNTSILENIALDTDRVVLKTTIKKLENYSLLQLFCQFPDGLATMIEERGLNISGGQRKLIGLARAVCSGPGILLSDELTSSADRNFETFVIELFMKLKYTIPILQVTHSLRSAAISDEILIIENGRVTNRGDHKSLMQTDNIYSQAFRDYLGHYTHAPWQNSAEN